ncbi:unnamed protein product [Ambrosiozyma monospora]|uniref:1,3-beta-glucanosyltransferase n=1 Tax=Ambrosiozyma monospora TaxID=43982 RepID=A0A9W6YXL5_AMBMO|nr:unnamed protein product [Ambrosiozyma monospora]
MISISTYLLLSTIILSFPNLVQSYFFSPTFQSNVAPVVIHGTKFFYNDTNSQFYVKGLTYQPDATKNQSLTDPLADSQSCERDIPDLMDLHTNVLRVNYIDPAANHSACMNMLMAAGIYVLVDLNEPHLSITDQISWTTSLYSRYTSVVDSLARYNNVLGFFVGDESTSSDSKISQAAPYLKSAVRDVKAFISDRGYRQIPVGFAGNLDGGEALSDFFTCGDDDSSRVDFYGYNDNNWCGSTSLASYSNSTGSSLHLNSTVNSSFSVNSTEASSNLGVPIFFSDYGCYNERTRHFNETSALYSDSMTSVLSGGVSGSYFQTSDGHGLVQVTETGIQKTAEFWNYILKITRIDPKYTNFDGIASSVTHPSCSLKFGNFTKLPPTPDSSTCSCLYDSLECVSSSQFPSNANITISSSELFKLNTLCQGTNCEAINSAPEKGVYGNYSFCSTGQKLSYVYNKYYSSSGVCDLPDAKLKESTNSGECRASSSAVLPNFQSKKTLSISSAESTFKASSTSQFSSVFTMIAHGQTAVVTFTSPPERSLVSTTPTTQNAKITLTRTFTDPNINLRKRELHTESTSSLQQQSTATTIITDATTNDEDAIHSPIMYTHTIPIHGGVRSPLPTHRTGHQQLQQKQPDDIISSISNRFKKYGDGCIENAYSISTTHECDLSGDLVDNFATDNDAEFEDVDDEMPFDLNVKQVTIVRFVTLTFDSELSEASVAESISADTIGSSSSSSSSSTSTIHSVSRPSLNTASVYQDFANPSLEFSIIGLTFGFICLLIV